MCVSLRTSTKQIQKISGRNKLSSYLTLSFSCRFVMLKKKCCQLQRRQRLRILVDSSILRANFVVRRLLLLLAQHKEGLVLKSTPYCDGELSRSTRVPETPAQSFSSASWWIEIAACAVFLARISAKASSRNSCRKHQHRSVQFADLSRSRSRCEGRRIKITEEIVEKLNGINNRP